MSLGDFRTGVAYRLFGRFPIWGYRTRPFASPIRRILGEKPLVTFAHFRTRVGFQLKPGKSVVGSPATFLGLLGDFPSSSDKFQLSVSLPQEKRTHWPHLIRAP